MAETIYFVYLLTFLNGKIYVGMSKTDSKGSFTVRYRQHALSAKKGKELPIYSAWRKYGAPNMTVLGMHSNREHCAIDEINTIASMQSQNQKIGYNLQPGGEGNKSKNDPIVYSIMREKVWDNPECRAKISAANKGKQPSQQALNAAIIARQAPEIRAKMREKIWSNPEVQAKISEKTRLQMANGGAEHLSKILSGRPDHLPPKSRAIQKQKVREFMNSEEGKEIAKRGNAAMLAKPGNKEKRDAGLNKWRKSAANAEHCKAMAKKSAEACRHKVLDKDTGVIYASQRDMAIALCISQAAVSLRVKSGKAIRL